MFNSTTDVYRAKRETVHFAKSLVPNYYQLAEGMAATLAHARVGIQDWFQIRSNRPRQLELKLPG